MPDRVQQEIEDLLARLETFPPRRPLWVRVRDGATAPFRAAWHGLGRVRLPSFGLTPGHLLLAAIAVIVIAYVAGGSSEIARWLIVGGIIVFIAAFVLSLRRQSRPPEKLWRGQPLDLRGERRSWWDRWRNRR
jgi:hypothetical protein